MSRRNEKDENVVTKMWDIAEDSWNDKDIHGGAGILENATLSLDEPELEAIVIRNASTSVTTSESEVCIEVIDLDDEVVFDCLVDYLLFYFSFKLVDCILIFEHHGMF